MWYFSKRHPVSAWTRAQQAEGLLLGSYLGPLGEHEMCFILGIMNISAKEDSFRSKMQGRGL